MYEEVEKEDDLIEDDFNEILEEFQQELAQFPDFANEDSDPEVHFVNDQD